MDLDKIKKSWNRVGDNALLPADYIRTIIQKKTSTVITKLLRLEVISFIILVPLLMLPYILDNYSPTKMAFPKYVKFLYTIFCLSGLFWQGYKISLLRKIDVLKSGILQCLKSILRYRLYIKFELLVGSIFVFIINSAYLYDRLIAGYTIKRSLYVLIMLWILIYVCIFFIYKYLYYNKIKDIEQALQEVDAMEKDN